MEKLRTRAEALTEIAQQYACGTSENSNGRRARAFEALGFSEAETAQVIDALFTWKPLKDKIRKAEKRELNGESYFRFDSPFQVSPSSDSLALACQKFLEDQTNELDGNLHALTDDELPRLSGEDNRVCYLCFDSSSGYSGSDLPWLREVVVEWVTDDLGLSATAVVSRRIASAFEQVLRQVLTDEQYLETEPPLDSALVVIAEAAEIGKAVSK